MPTYVPDRPPMTQLSDHAVGLPVSHRHGMSWRDTLNFLNGFVLQPIVSCNLKQASGSPRSYTFAYRRSPGCRALAIFAELHDATGGANCRVAATRSGGAISFLPDSTPANGPFRSGAGAQVLPAQNSYITDRVQYQDVIDVSGLTPGVLEWITLTWTDGPTVGTHGLCRVHTFEVPRRDIAVDSSDAGVDGGWTFAGNGLFDGDGVTDLDGFKRLRNELVTARKSNRRHIQLLAPENVADAFQCGASVGVFAPALFGFATQPKWWLKARKLYTSADANPYKFLCRYSTQHATATADIKVTATSRTTGTVATATLALAANTGFQASGEATLSVPTDGFEGDVSWALDFKTQAGANLVLSDVALIEDEV